jgi:ribonuclease HII
MRDDPRSAEGQPPATSHEPRLEARDEGRTSPIAALSIQRGVKGINFSIAAASIVAKTERDRMMDELDREHPGYGFASHKGYATSEHRAALKRLGPSAVHRMSFPIIGELRGEWSAVFYHFRVKLDEVRNAAALRELETALTAEQDALPEREYQKLRLLVARRWKLITNSRNS